MQKNKSHLKITGKALPLLGMLGTLLPFPASAHDAGAGPIGLFFTSFPVEGSIALAAGLTLTWLFYFSRRRKNAIALSLLVFLVAFSAWTLQQTGLALAATSSLSPNGGECIKGGANVNIQWTSDDANYSHGYASFSMASGAPGSYATFNGGGPNFLGHVIFSPFSWTTPAITNNAMRVYVESHDGPHSVLSSILSASDFAIDSSVPTAATVSSPSKTATTVNLSWTASTDAGCMGLTGYKLLRDGTEIATGLSATTFNDTGLSASTTYSYVVRAYDNFGSTDSVALGVTTSSPPDTTAPAAITTLATSAPTVSSLTVGWTAPGDDGAVGTATSYDIRYSTAAITTGNFGSATQVNGEPAPQVAGTVQSMVVPGLNAATAYFFAMQTSDEVPNVSALSNVASGTTSSPASGGGGTPTPASVTVSKPNGGETIDADTTYQLFWGSGGGGIQTIRLSLSTDSGITYPTLIKSGEPNDGVYDWTVPASASTTARVKVEAIGTGGTVLASDASNGDFTINIPSTGGTPSTTPPATTPSETPSTPSETAPSGTNDPVPLTDAEKAAPTTDPNSAGSYSPSGATAATPTIDVDKGIVPPLATQLPCIGGTLIKIAGNPAVYYCGKNGKRYVFPGEKIFFTWYKDFKSVTTLTPDQMAKIQIGGNVTYKPGVKMVKIQTDPKVYAIARAGLLRWVKDEVVAAALYGARWNRLIDDVPDSFFFSYTIGDPIE